MIIAYIEAILYFGIGLFLVHLINIDYTSYLLSIGIILLCQIKNKEE